MTSILEIKQNDLLKNYLSNKKYNGLCLSGGGVSGYFMLGVLHYLDIYLNINDIDYYYGTSIGSALNLLLIIGYKPIDILKFVCKNDISEILFPSLLSIKEGYGLYDINLLKNYLKELLISKLGDNILTFKELYDKTNKFFCCTSYCLNSEENQIYFNHVDTPNVSILDAVISSCSIPFIFSKNYIEDKCYIDGAFFNNYPVDKLYAKMIESKLNNINLLGINISSKKYDKINSFTDYVSSILNFIVDLQYSNKKDLIDNLKKENKLDHIQIEKGFSFDFKDNTSSRINLYCEGIKIIKEYFLDKIKNQV
jgi:hypothetical protein